MTETSLNQQCWRLAQAGHQSWNTQTLFEHKHKSETQVWNTQCVFEHRLTVQSVHSSQPSANTYKYNLRLCAQNLCLDSSN